MSLAQLSALTGKRIKPSYVEQINAQTPYLPELYAQKKTESYLDEANEIRLAGLELAKQQAREEKRAQKKANRLGYLNLGLNTGLGLAGLASTYDPISRATPVLADATFDAAGLINPSGAIPGVQELSSNSFSPLDLVSSGVSAGGDILKNIGGGAWDFAKGLYDDTIGSLVSWL